MDLYDRLIGILEPYLDTYPGTVSLRGVQIAIFLLQESIYGQGLSVSEIHRYSGAPLESVRRHMHRREADGELISERDPKDDRVRRYRVAQTEPLLARHKAMAGEVYALRPPTLPEERPRPFSRATTQALIDVLVPYGDAYQHSMRFRGFKTALLIQKATTTGEGITASELARSTRAPLETVRRHMLKHTELGDLTMLEDPKDERALRVRSAKPDEVAELARGILRGLEAVDWGPLKLAH